MKTEYRTRCNGNCTERIDTQAQTIQRLHRRNAKKSKALIEASKEIAKLKAEKQHITEVLNKTAEQKSVLEGELKYHQYTSKRPVNMRIDQNWDSMPRIEVSE